MPTPTVLIGEGGKGATGLQNYLSAAGGVVTEESFPSDFANALGCALIGDAAGILYAMDWDGDLVTPYASRLRTSTDGGATWATLGVVLPALTGSDDWNPPFIKTAAGTWLVCAMEFITGASARRKIARSTDNGATWTTVLIPDSAAPFGGDASQGSVIPVWFVQTQNGSLLLAIDLSEPGGSPVEFFAILKSTDDGQTWSFVHTSAGIEAHGLQVLPGNVVLARTGDSSTAPMTFTQIYRSTDNGATWTSVLNDLTESNVASWTPAFVMVQPNGTWVTFIAKDRWTSTDSGATWTKDLTFTAPVSWDWVNGGGYDPAYLYIIINSNVSSHAEVWVSTDGVTWTSAFDIGQAYAAWGWSVWNPPKVILADTHSPVPVNLYERGVRAEGVLRSVAIGGFPSSAAKQYDADGFPDAPCEQQFFGTLRTIFWPVDVGDRTFSIYCRSPLNSAFAPRAVVKANPIVGIPADVVLPYTDSANQWQALTFAFTAQQAGVVEVWRVVPGIGTAGLSVGQGDQAVFALWDDIEVS